jgi:hypothetical protein
LKAAVYSRYAPPEVVEIKDVQKPVPKDIEEQRMLQALTGNPPSTGRSKKK